MQKYFFHDFFSFSLKLLIFQIFCANYLRNYIPTAGKGFFTFPEDFSRRVITISPSLAQNKGRQYPNLLGHYPLRAQNSKNRTVLWRKE